MILNGGQVIEQLHKREKLCKFTRLTEPLVNDYRHPRESTLGNFADSLKFKT